VWVRWVYDYPKEVKMRYIVLFFLLVMPFNVYAITGEEIVRKYQEAFLYQGNDFKAKVVMRLISPRGKQRVREMTMIRKNYGTTLGEQKYFIYFFKPADVKDMTFMVYKYPQKDDDRWLFIPALKLVKRIAAQDKKSSFVGSDFTYEDVSGRDIEDDIHELLREEVYNNQNCYVVKSTPKSGDMDYKYKLSWINKVTYLPLREEYIDSNDETIRVFTADEIRDVKGYPTILMRTMKNLKSGHKTEAVFTEVEYNVGIKDSLFSERFLRRPLKNGWSKKHRLEQMWESIE
jgi:hypothetical protein